MSQVCDWKIELWVEIIIIRHAKNTIGNLRMISAHSDPCTTRALCPESYKVCRMAGNQAHCLATQDGRQMHILSCTKGTIKTFKGRVVLMLKTTRLTVK